MSQVFNFAEATVPVEQVSEYINAPGYYVAKIGNVELIKAENSSPYLAITFDTEQGKVIERFFITEKTLGRLKALYQSVWNQELTQTLTGVDSVGDFFKAALGKSVSVTIRVIAEKTGEKVFHKLPFANFIVNDEEPRIVLNTDSDYNDWVKIRKVNQPTSEATIQQSNTQSSTSSTWTPPTDEDDSLPF